MVCFLTLPVWVISQWQNLQIGELSAKAYQSPWLKSYVWGCGVWGLVKLALVLSGDKRRDPSETLLSWKQEPSFLAKGLGREIYQGVYPQALSYIPFNQVSQITIDYKRLRIPRLHEAHEGMRLVHISDLHLTGRIAPSFYQRVVEQVNELQADAVMITGDIVEKVACIPWLTESLTQLKAVHGVYFVLGNHDRYIDRQETISILCEAGFRYLKNEWLETEWRGQPVVLVGNELPWEKEATSFPPSPSRTQENLPLKIGLVHTPDQYDWVVQNDIDLAMAGHTHGGQIRLPVLGAVACPSRYGTRYACGVFRRENTVLHVTRGVCGKMPLRWDCPPEIAVLELTSKEQ